MEIFDDDLAENYMPGKRCYNKEFYINSLTEAVNVFGVGNVRCAFVVGLEKTESLLNGIENFVNLMWFRVYQYTDVYLIRLVT